MFRILFWDFKRENSANCHKQLTGTRVIRPGTLRELLQYFDFNRLFIDFFFEKNRRQTEAKKILTKIYNFNHGKNTQSVNKKVYFTAC